MDGSGFHGEDIGPPPLPGVDAYFELNALNGKQLIDRFVADLHALVPGDRRLMALRRKYYRTVIARGVDLNKLLSAEQIARMPLGQMKAAITLLPDRAREETRKDFAAAGDARTETARWNNLFPENTDDVLIPLHENAQSFDDKIAAFIDEYNRKAAERLAAARNADAADPGARPTAGRHIDQRQIRRAKREQTEDGDGKKRTPETIEVLDPNAQGERWLPGPKLGKFLQEQLRWDMLDSYQKLDDKKPAVQTESRRADLYTVAHRNMLDLDQFFDSGSLRILISRDPQKVGEMSSGTRWWSCMGEDQDNFKYVSPNIEAGTIVGYIVSEDDPQGRYPLARQLLKPFTNDKGEIVLVPARPYGGNAQGTRTLNALEHALIEFSAPQNANKAGTFVMNENLYADGQATTVVMGGAWTRDRIPGAMRHFRTGALEEWLVELRKYEKQLGSAPRHGHDRDPAKEIALLRSKLTRVYNIDDLTGLPRIFYRAMRATVGSIPEPADIMGAITDDPAFGPESRAFKALLAGDVTGWNANKNLLSASEAVQLTFTAAAISTPNSDIEKTAAAAWSEAAHKAPRESLESDLLLDWAKRLAVPGSALRAHIYDFILDQAPEEPTDRLKTANKVIVAAANSPEQYARAGDIALKAAFAIENPDRRIEAFTSLLNAWKEALSDTVEIGGQRKALINKILRQTLRLPTEFERLRVAENIAQIAGSASGFEDRRLRENTANAIVLHNIGGHAEPGKRIRSALDVAIRPGYKTRNLKRATKQIWIDFDALPTDRARVTYADMIARNLEGAGRTGTKIALGEFRSANAAHAG